MNNKKIIFIVATLILGGLFLICFIISIGAYFFSKEIRVRSISNFEECVVSGYPIMDSYPQQCATPDGRTFVEELPKPNITAVPSNDEVRVYSPIELSYVNSPMYIEGDALGSWYWEGTFNIELRSQNGDVIGSTLAQTEEDWMQEGYVRFTATMVYDTDEKIGDLVFIKENPPGLPENDDEYSISVYLSQSTSADGCIITGCSGQICSDEEVATTCEYKNYYGCYASATCERQSNGQCGWTQTPELLVCIEDSNLPFNF